MDLHGQQTYGERSSDQRLRNQASLWTTPQAHDEHPGDANRVGRYGTKAGGGELDR